MRHRKQLRGRKPKEYNGKVVYWVRFIDGKKPFRIYAKNGADVLEAFKEFFDPSAILVEDVLQHGVRKVS